MKPYVDSGVLVKLYVLERDSTAAARSVARFKGLALNPLQELEIRNTFRALEGRGSITTAQRAASEHTLEGDITSGRLRRVIPDWTSVFHNAMGISQEFAAETLARSLDILHVAIATAAGADVFITSDTRQAAVARRAGLSTRTIG